MASFALIRSHNYTRFCNDPARYNVSFSATATGGSGTYTDYMWHWEQFNTTNRGNYDSGSFQYVLLCNLQTLGATGSTS